MSKIVYFTPRPFSLAYGGLEVQLFKTKSAVEQRGLRVELIDYFDKTQISRGDLVHLFGSDHVFSQIAKLLSAEGIPYVCSPVYYPIRAEWLLHHLSARVPYSQNWLRGTVLRGAARLLPNSNSEARLLKDMFGVDRSRIEVIHNAVDVSLKGEDPEKFRKKYLPGLPHSERFILSVGRIEPRKNTIALLRAAAKLRVPIVLIGEPVRLHHEYLKIFYKEVEKYPTYIKHIPFLAHTGSDLGNAYAAAHVSALLSWLETPGLVNLEAGLNGANLVLGDSAPVKEYFKGVAWFTKPNNINNIMLALEKALNSPRDALGQSKHIATNFTWDRVGQKMMKIYCDILESSQCRC